MIAICNEYIHMSKWTIITYILKHNHLGLEIFCPNRDVV